MGFTVSTTGFERNELLRRNAQSILTKAVPSASSKVSEAAVFANNSYENPQLAIAKASAQITVNTTLNETLKYLRTHANKKRMKTPVFGELWNIVSANNEDSEKNPYKGELYDFQINSDAKNIFAA